LSPTCPQIALKTGHETVRNRVSTANQREILSPYQVQS
jgi:hypothetical protein